MQYGVQLMGPGFIKDQLALWPGATLLLPCAHGKETKGRGSELQPGFQKGSSACV